jgi:hypothetical protein
MYSYWLRSTQPPTIRWMGNEYQFRLGKLVPGTDRARGRLIICVIPLYTRYVGQVAKHLCVGLSSKRGAIQVSSHIIFTSVTNDINKYHNSSVLFLACNCIISSAPRKKEIMHLSLQESYASSILLYGCPALNLAKTQTSDFNACWNSVYRKLFGYNMR